MQTDPSELEMEVKFHLPEIKAFREKALAMGARSLGRIFERNLCFDTPDGLLRTGDRLLRLRQDDGIRLTYKAPPVEMNREVKAYREIELNLSSFASMRAIFAELGFQVAQTYEKWRETFVLGEAHLCLDELPFGHFLEIEASPMTIRSLAARLDLNWGGRILLDYLAIFEAVRTATGSTCREPTFAACADLIPLPADFWDQLQAG